MSAIAYIYRQSAKSGVQNQMGIGLECEQMEIKENKAGKVRKVSIQVCTGSE